MSLLWPRRRRGRHRIPSIAISNSGKWRPEYSRENLLGQVYACQSKVTLGWANRIQMSSANFAMFGGRPGF